MKKSSEPIFWSLFGAGGMLSALVAPVLILVTGLLAPLGFGMPADALDYGRVHGFVQHWLGKLVVLALIALFLFHAVHRIYHSLHDLGVRTGTAAMAACYGSALGATLTAAILLLIVS